MQPRLVSPFFLQFSVNKVQTFTATLDHDVPPRTNGLGVALPAVCYNLQLVVVIVGVCYLLFLFLRVYRILYGSGWGARRACGAENQHGAGVVGYPSTKLPQFAERRVL